jgi:hypothetical protein
MPGVGAGSCGPLLSLLMGRGDSFLILLDDDKAGKKEAERYKDQWFLEDESVFTLAKIDPVFAGMQIENLLTADTLKIIGDNLGTASQPNKKQIGWYLAEMCATDRNENCLSPSTLENLIRVLDYLNNRFD